MHNKQKVLEYWENENVESMYDKFLISSEVELIRSKISKNVKILDAGCGEGEGTLIYSDIPGSQIHAVDFSDTRLRKARERLRKRNNVTLKKVDFLGTYILDNDYDVIISQRFLINLMEWDLQKRVIVNLMSILKPGGKFLMLEGSIKGVNELNEFRNLIGLQPIPIKWHNLFFDDKKLISFMKGQNYILSEVNGIGEYFLLTRGIRPFFDSNLDWNSKFNKIAHKPELKKILGFGEKFSRLKLWIFSKQ